MDRLWNSFKNRKNHKDSKQELSKSRYSLVSTSEVTADTLQLWLELPEEVKYDPALEQIRQIYEKEHGREKIPLRPSKESNPKRLHAVNSAPALGRIEEIKNGGQKHAFDIIEELGEKSEEKISNNVRIRQKPSRTVHAKYYTKMTILLACWMFFTAVFLMYNEKQDIVRTSSIVPGEEKNYTLHFDGEPKVLVKLTGPFLTENAEMKMNQSQLDGAHRMMVWLERSDLSSIREDTEKSQTWSIILQNENSLDFNIGVPRSTILRIESYRDSNQTYSLKMNMTASRTMPFTLSYMVNPIDATTGVIYSVVLLCGLYILIIFEIVNRTMAAITVATTSLAVLALAGERPTLPEVISWLDEETLVLLFSMMILVAIMAETGIFDFLAVYAFEITKGKLWPLIYLLCIVTGVLSTFLDNVTTVLLMSPVTIRLCEVMDLDPVPILMFMAMYSNIGGTATPVGDPPNVIVASNKAVIDAGINFTNFTAHMALGIVFVTIQASLQIRFMFRDTNKLRLAEPREIQEIRHQISIWRRAADSLPHLSNGVGVVRERLERKISKLDVQLKVLQQESSGRACPREAFQGALQGLKEKYKIRDKVLLIKATVAIAFVVIVFFLHSIPELNRVSLAWTALLGAILLLTLADREDLEPILHRVEWSTLLFFAALFVLMEALSKLGLILYIGGLMEQLIIRVNEESRLAVAILLVIWVSGVISACVDNIPLTTMMVRVVVSIGSNPALNLPMGPLIWALLYGACLGGNGTLIGASANVVCAGVAEQHGYKFSFGRFLRVGLPIMIGHLIVASAYLLVCHCVFSWH
ncbi:P protein-like [Ostrinia furnacalis]|uniref:P protein-like n=1 Tax=Ostrinia furnacalis TaxID=93504 RepID=UPI00103BBC5A|nr:P protein-like [Ostrinia furnacalis]XP_028167089.1 P protein-like [Ostrinia furnacalis]